MIFLILYDIHNTKTCFLTYQNQTIPSPVSRANPSPVGFWLEGQDTSRVEIISRSGRWVDGFGGSLFIDYMHILPPLSVKKCVLVLYDNS